MWGWRRVGKGWFWFGCGGLGRGERGEGLISIRCICGGGGCVMYLEYPFGSALNYYFFTVSPFFGLGVLQCSFLIDVFIEY